MFKFLKENIRRFNVNTKKFYHGRYLRAWFSLFIVRFVLAVVLTTTIGMKFTKRATTKEANLLLT